ncbi:MAG TPA: VOC family protein [Rhizomicrobium sp.]|nr:VOC family protein [Rhizomicrobium sp.]
MKLNTYLHFPGNCHEAFKFYEKALGGKIVTLQTYGDSPAAAQSPAGWKDKIIHARIEVGDTLIMGSDAPPDRQAKAQGFSLSLRFDTAAQAERAFQALSDKGVVGAALQESFFAERFGMVTDRFGTPWMVLCEKKQG